MTCTVIHFANNLTDGAGRAAYRLHRALLDMGVASRMSVLRKDFADDSVHGFLKNYVIPGQGRDYRRLLNFGRFTLRKVAREVTLGRIKPLNLFTLNIPFVRFMDIAPQLEGVDVVCLHSVESFLSSGLIRQIHRYTGAPLVWNVVDSEPLTGGCHFNDDCRGFTRACGYCPQLTRSGKFDRSRRTLRKKRKDLSDLPIHFAAGSSWARDHILDSALFNGHIIKPIPLCVDDTFRIRVPREMARRVLGLPAEKKIILFGCFNIDEERKGGRYLVEALGRLADDINDAAVQENIVLATVGGKSGFGRHRLPFEWVDLGKIADDRVMALAFKSADVYACPSIDDFGPMMINESIACGTPVVAFRSGVAPDLILDDDIGHIADRRNVNEFKTGLSRFVLGPAPDTTSGQWPAVQNRLEPSYQAAQYLALFEAITAAMV